MINSLRKFITHPLPWVMLVVVVVIIGPMAYGIYLNVQRDKVTEFDVCAFERTFDNCMKLLPAGPQSTHYNDWDEVVQECRFTAYRMAEYRPADLVPPECRRGKL